MARVTKARALTRLRKLLNEIPRLKELTRNSPEFKRWHRNSKATIVDIFGNKAEHVEEFSWLLFSPRAVSMDNGRLKLHNSYKEDLDSAKSIIEYMIDEINEYWIDGDRSGKSPSPAKGRLTTSVSKKVFVVHGHDEAAKQTVARLLERLGLEPIVLHEQANRGATIIEKFEDYADVGFAVVLLTPDDTGAPAGDDEAKAPRARQNVVFEMGFFMGKLGRKKVAVLLKGDLEKPSDADGIVYIPLDDGSWRFSLVKELKTAGFDVDANQAL